LQIFQQYKSWFGGGEDVNEEDKDGITPLVASLKSYGPLMTSDPRITEFLFDSGANIDPHSLWDAVPFPGMPSLFLKKRPELGELCIDNMEYFSKFCTFDKESKGDSLLIKAARTGDAEFVSFLLEKRIIYVNYKNLEGQTALVSAILERDSRWFERKKIVQLLLKNGASVDVSFSSFILEVIYESKKGSIFTLRKLIDKEIEEGEGGVASFLTATDSFLSLDTFFFRRERKNFLIEVKKMIETHS